MLSIIWTCSVLFVACANGQFEVPPATVEAYTPRGFRVSIPDQEGIKLFAFHGKINEEFEAREGGTFSKDILSAKDGRWTFYEPYTKLKKGDVIYYWTYVDYFDGKNKLGYPNDDQQYVVTELIPKPGAQPQPTPSPTTAPTTASTPSIPTRIDIPGGGSCDASETLVQNRRVCKGKLIFSDTFNKAALSKYWKVERKFGWEPDYEFVLYQNNTQVLTLSDQQLRIKPTLTDEVFGEEFVVKSPGLDLGENCTGVAGSAECYQSPGGWAILPPVISAQITTKDRFSFKYGKIEIRAKLPKGDWLYPELFLNSENEEYGSGFESGQIRVAFTPGNEAFSQTLFGGIVLGDSRPARNYGMKNIQRTTSWTNAFHRYTITWRPDSFTMSVDDKVYGNIFPPDNGFAGLAANLHLPQYASRWRSGTKLAPFDKEMFITIGVGAGGQNFEDKSDGTKPWVNTEPISQKNFYKARSQWKSTWSDDSALIVDSVKVWAI